MVDFMASVSSSLGPLVCDEVRSVYERAAFGCNTDVLNYSSPTSLRTSARRHLGLCV